MTPAMHYLIGQVAIRQYITALETKCYLEFQQKAAKLLPIPKKGGKAKMEEVMDQALAIPTIENVEESMHRTKFSVDHLKTFARHYNLRLSGTKHQLFVRVYSFLRLSFFARKIQSLVRGVFQRRLNRLRGPAFLNRASSNNEADLFTGDEVQDIPTAQFFSYRDEDEKIYSFDFLSLFNIVFEKKHGSTIFGGRNLLGEYRPVPNPKNPYNRSKIPAVVGENMRTIVRLSNLLKTAPVEFSVQKEELTPAKSFSLRVLELFQGIDSLGNYSDPQWFLALTHPSVARFSRELSDIWHYRLHLSIAIKRLICPPLGDPFRGMSTLYENQSYQMTMQPDVLREFLVRVMEAMVFSSQDVEYRKLGAMYVLSALTLVSSPAASALPWLHQSVALPSQLMDYQPAHQHPIQNQIVVEEDAVPDLELQPMDVPFMDLTMEEDDPPAPLAGIAAPISLIGDDEF